MEAAIGGMTHFGFFGSIRILLKNNSTTISTAESEPPGCPNPAVPIIVMISRRIRFAMNFNSSVDFGINGTT